MQTSNRIDTAHRGRVRRNLAVLVIAGTLAACGGGGRLPPSQLADAPAESLDTITTTLPLFPSDDQVSDDQVEDTPPSDGQVEIDATPIPNRDAVLTTGQAWTDATSNLVGLESTCGNVSYLTAQPSTTGLFAGIATQGVFRLDEPTGLWVQLGTSDGSDQISNRMSWIEFDPNDTNRFWQSGTYSAGLFRTDDGGSTFKQMGDVRHVDYVSTDPTDPFRTTMLAGGHEDRKVYLSTDGGSSWTDIAGTLPPDVGFTAYPVVRDSSTFLLGTRRADNAGIFRTEDGGITWTSLHDGAITGPPLIDGENIYWLADQGGPVVVSTDGGRTFAPRGNGIGGRPSTLRKMQDGRLVTHNETAIMVSDDQGESWFPAGPPLPFVPDGIVVTGDDSAIYAWLHTCNFGEGGNPVLPESIVRLELPEAASTESG